MCNIVGCMLNLSKLVGNIGQARSLLRIFENKPGNNVLETKCFRRTRSCDMNEFVNAGEVENENGRDRVKVVKIRIDSGNNKQN